MTEHDEPTEGQMIPDSVYEKVLANEKPSDIPSIEEAARLLDGEDEQPIDPPAEDEPAGDAPAEPAAELTAAEAMAKALEDVKEVQKRIDDRLDALAKEPEPKAAEPVADEVDPDIAILLASDDPRDQAMGRQLQKQAAETKAVAERFDKREAAEHEAAKTELAAQLEVAIEAVGAACNPPLTEAEKDAVVDWMTDDTKGTPLAESLTFDQAVHALHPGRLTATKGKATAGAPKGAPEGATPAGKPRPSAGTGTVFDRTGSAGPTPAERTPPANETMEQAIARGSRQLRLTR